MRLEAAMKLAALLSIVGALWPVATGAQTVSLASGGGELSRTVVATWEAHGDPGAPPLGGSRTLDLSAAVPWNCASMRKRTPRTSRIRSFRCRDPTCC